MESKQRFDYLYSLSPKRLVINREISPFSVFTDQSLFIADLGWVWGSEDFGCVTLKLTRTPIRLCNILMTPTNCQFIGNLFSLVPPLNCVSDDWSYLRFPWKPSTPPPKKSSPNGHKNDWSLKGNQDLLRRKKWRRQDATFPVDKACLIRQLLD